MAERMLDKHIDAVHVATPQPPAHGHHGGWGGKPNKLVTPKLEIGIGPDKFGNWTRYRYRYIGCYQVSVDLYLCGEGDPQHPCEGHLQRGDQGGGVIERPTDGPVVRPTMQLSWLRTVNKVLPEVKTANTVSEKDMESPPAEMSGRGVV